MGSFQWIMRSASIATLVCFTGCGLFFRWSGGVAGSGTIVREARQIESFDKIEFAGAGTVSIDVGQKSALELECDDNLLPLIQTEVQNGTLHIQPSEMIAPTKELRINISTEHLERFVVAGSCVANIQGVDGTSLTLVISGAGTIRSQGVCDELAVEIAGAGDVDCLQVVAKSVQVHVAGSGDVRVHALDQLKVNIAGSGKVVYQGSPTIEQDIAGAGSVKAHTSSNAEQEIQ